MVNIALKKIVMTGAWFMALFYGGLFIFEFP
jgi:hypothetical protein